MYVAIQLRIREVAEGQFEPGFIITEYFENRRAAEQPFWCHSALQQSEQDALRAARVMAYEYAEHRYPDYVRIQEVNHTALREVPGEEQPMLIEMDADPEIGISVRAPKVLQRVLRRERQRMNIAKRRKARQEQVMAWLAAHERPNGY